MIARRGADSEVRLRSQISVLLPCTRAPLKFTRSYSRSRGKETVAIYVSIGTAALCRSMLRGLTDIFGHVNAADL